MNLPHTWTAPVDFTRAFFSTPDGGSPFDTDQWDAIAAAIGRLKFVNEVWINHTCVAVIETNTARLDVAARRVEQAKRKIAGILRRYTPKHS